jgi:hypothetical protein
VNNQKNVLARLFIVTNNIRFTASFSISLSDHSFSALAFSFAVTFAHSKPLWRFMFFSKRAFNALSSSSHCSVDSSFFVLTPFIPSKRLSADQFTVVPECAHVFSIRSQTDVAVGAYCEQCGVLDADQSGFSGFEPSDLVRQLS